VSKRWVSLETRGIRRFGGRVKIKVEERISAQCTAGRGEYPPVFSYQGETKELRENGRYEGELKDLAASALREKRSG
jgi:hypothetical protein